MYKWIIAAHLGDGVPERKILYEDPKLGFQILAHVNEKGRAGQPHDHGASWAIYGQAVGETVMSDWAIVEPAACRQCVEQPRHGAAARNAARYSRIRSRNPFSSIT